MKEHDYFGLLKQFTSLNLKVNSFINAMSDNVVITLSFDWCFGGGVKKGMDSFGTCLIEK